MLRTAIAFAVFSVFTGYPAAAEKNLRVALEAFPPSLGNPHRTSLSPSIYTLAAIFDGLTRIEADGSLSPALAVRWESVDALTWRFHLRPGVVFSNGTPLTSDAFVTAVNYLASDEALKEGLKQELAILKGARAVDELTLDIITTEPVATFPRYGAAISAAEPDLWRALGREEFARQPVGTGPFKVDAMAANRWRLSAFTRSWRPAQVDKLELLMLPDASSRVQALEAGRVDVALVIGPDNIEALEAAGARVETFITATTFAITLRTTAGGPFADVRVRRALNYAINRDRIVATLLAGRTVASGQPATRGVFGHDPGIAPYPYDPARAKALLAEAGYADGFAFTLDAAISSSAADAAVFQQVQADLRDVGVDMTINTMTYPMFLSKTVRTEFDGDAFPISWAAWPTLDALRAMEMHSCLRLVPWFCDPALVPVMREALAERDEARALALRRQVARALHDQASGLLLYELPVFVGLSRRVRDFTMVGYRIFYDRIRLDP